MTYLPQVAEPSWTVQSRLHHSRSTNWIEMRCITVVSFNCCFRCAGLALELLSPAVPRAFLLLASLGSIARSITGDKLQKKPLLLQHRMSCRLSLSTQSSYPAGVAGGASRAALTQHFATQQNAADISAKEGSQETATTLLGMLLGMLVLQLCAGMNAPYGVPILVRKSLGFEPQAQGPGAQDLRRSIFRDVSALTR